MSKFVSLHNHSSYSILSALPSPKDLFLRAKELDQPALAVTDYGTMAGMWNAYKASKEIGIKFIAGCEFYFTNDVNNKSNKLRYVVLIAKNAIGYKNILTLHRKGFDNHSIILKKVFPIIDWKLLQEYSEGVICLTACGNGIVGQLLNTKKFDEAELTIKRLKDMFGENLGLEVQTHNLIRNQVAYLEPVNQTFTNSHIIRLAKKFDIKVVPTCNTHYLKQEDAETHDVLMAVGSMQPTYSNGRVKFNVKDLYLKKYEDVKAFFLRNHGEKFAEEICENTLFFADKCESPDWVSPKYSNPSGKELPIFPVKDEPDYTEFLNWWKNQNDEVKKFEEDRAYLRFKCLNSIVNKIPKGKEKEYYDRMEYELDVLNYCGVNSYMLITAEFLNWARKNDIFVSVGRGSGGGSLVGYLLDIHKADSIKYGLVFERFFSKKRSSYADIDNDISKKHRDRVIQHLIDKYGKDNVSYISNVIEVTPKVFARDIARSCELGGSREKAVDLGNNVADIIPKKFNDEDVKTYNDIIKASPLFSEYCEKYTEYKKYSSICGLQRSQGIHASGILVTARPLIGLAPLRTDKDHNVVIEYDKDVSEENGFVKIDILGLNTLDIIDATNKIIKEAGKQVPEIDYEAYDEKTYDLIARGDTFGVFQFGTSAGTIELCKKIKPKDMEDLAIITTLARPASKEIREDFIKTRGGEMQVRYLHPSLENALKNTFGFPLYDESLLVLAQDVAGWDLAEADKLRKLTKMKGSDPKKAIQWRNEFIDGAVKNNIKKEDAIEIWDKIVEPYGRYSFNKSHAVLYSMVSYHTAYLKAHFPLEFLLANLKAELHSNTPDAEQNIEKIKQEIRNQGIKIIPPDVNKSDISFKIIGENMLLTGLEALKFVGDEAIKEIIEKRPFSSFEDFMFRTTTAVRATSIQALAAAGALDFFGISRKLIFLYCQDYRKKLQVWLKKHDPEKEKFEYPWPIEKDWSAAEIYALEKEYLGEVFSCTKKEAFGNFFNKDHIFYLTIDKLYNLPDKTRVKSIKAQIKNIFEFKIKKEGKNLGKDMLKALIEDEDGNQMSLTVFPDQLKELKDKLKEKYKSKYKLDDGIAIHFEGSVNIYDDVKGLILNNIYNLVAPPEIPKDLKPKKISTPKIGREIKEETGGNSSSEIFKESLEDELFINGFIDIDEEDNDD